MCGPGVGPEGVRQRRAFFLHAVAKPDADRSEATGTGFVGQYLPEVRKRYETADATPDELLLFFHHVPYEQKLHSGKTVIQTIYDSHYDGAERAAHFVHEWETLRGHVDAPRFREVHEQLAYQAGHAIVWRDAINNWFYSISGVVDEKGRVGRHPGRIEAESMQLDGYTPVEVTSWEGASGGKAIQCAEPARACRARTQFNGAVGLYEIDVEHFDQNNGVSSYRLFVENKLIDEWKAGLRLPATAPNGDSSTRRRITGVVLRPGDEIRVEGFPYADERAPLDYITVLPVPLQHAARSLGPNGRKN